MNHLSNLRSGKDVESLRNKDIAVPNSESGVLYPFTESDLDDAQNHLRRIYGGRVTRPFAAKILLLNEIYKKDKLRKYWNPESNKF